MPHDVFLSYASADRAAAAAVCAALEARGIVCWMAPRDVKAGADWGEAILTAIGRAHAMVLILSRHTAGSVHVRNEVVTAVSQGLALVPVRIEDCQPGGALRLHLAGAHWLDVFPPPLEPHADALAAGVRLALAADATVEIPRAQAAAMVAAARASQAGRPAPPGTPMPAPPRPAAPTPPRPAPPPRAGQPAAQAPRRAGAGLLVALVVLGLLLGIGAVAWLFEARLRAMLGLSARVEVESAPAPVQGLRLVNAGAETVTRLHLGRAGEGPGAEDWLGHAQVMPGHAVLLRARPGEGCLFDLRAVYVGGRVEERPGVDLCAGPELRLGEGGSAQASSSR
ncbi:hypothetical protein FHS88_002308 [Roseomonas alkaliterrae]|uniref:TIR domain-containing protein n=2 Tax=Neoroseomonas alkaliterrae TaxID=1452450 RepID=A0A840XNN0_9PROT|nr:toll/interleukin-1 receptor domain-containing protein [Neoroseomonas alkaliterrae]MBB5690175.1 hypothetical protein [Neoroseomonas alkaliterrae]